MFKRKKTIGAAVNRIVPRKRKTEESVKPLTWYEYQEIDKQVREKKLFLRCGLYLQDFAEMFDKSRTRMSEIVNSGSGMSFNMYLNWYRVQYMKWLLECDPEQLIEDAAMKSGFGSQPSMNSAFRRHIGVHPNEIARFYLKQKIKRGPLSRTPVLELIPPHSPSLRDAQKLKIWREGRSLHLG